MRLSTGVAPLGVAAWSASLTRLARLEFAWLRAFERSVVQWLEGLLPSVRMPGMDVAMPQAPVPTAAMPRLAPGVNPHRRWRGGSATGLSGVSERILARIGPPFPDIQGSSRTGARRRLPGHSLGKSAGRPTPRRCTFPCRASRAIRLLPWRHAVRVRRRMIGRVPPSPQLCAHPNS